MGKKLEFLLSLGLWVSFLSVVVGATQYFKYADKKYGESWKNFVIAADADRNGKTSMEELRAVYSELGLKASENYWPRPTIEQMEEYIVRHHKFEQEP